MKAERANPGGSIKDRIALLMIEDAEKKGVLKQSPDLSSRVRESIEWYVATLIRKCGPVVDLLLKIRGPEKQREYTRSAMFGI